MSKYQSYFINIKQAYSIMNRTLRMIKIIPLLLIISLVSCKNNKSKEETDELKKDQSSVDVIKEIAVGGIESWELRGIELNDVGETHMNDKIYHMRVIDHEETYTFAAINNIKIAYTGGRYRISVIVKPPTENDNFGIRIQEIYPTRLDAVFDFSKEVVRGDFEEGGFVEKEKIELESLDDGWYKCTIYAYIHASYFRLIFGPTNVPKSQIKSWESELLNDNNRELFILPNSIKIEELEY